MKLVRLPVLILLLSLGSAMQAATVWQYSVPAPTAEGRRAYLWIPPDAPRVRGLVVACQNMLEKPLFERPAFRAAAAENGLGLLLVFPGRDPKGATGENNSFALSSLALYSFLMGLTSHEP